MSQPGIKYVVYGFLGNRTGRKGGTNQNLPAGTGLGENCYRFKIFDSSSNEQPIILSPLHEILENTAGTLSFTLLRNAKITPVFRKTGESATTETSYDYPVEARPFMFVKQTEFVIFRYMLIKENNTEVYKIKELWSGRLDSISKDFYGDWKITFEGELAYLNDFYINYEKASDGGTTPEANKLFRDFINVYHNNRIANLPQEARTIDTSSLPPMGPSENPTNPQSVPILNRKFKVMGTDAYDNGKKNIKIPTKANLEDGYTISEGTVWSNIQVLLDRYGGHVWVYKDITDGVLTRCIKWNESETKETDGKLPGYNNDGVFQPLKFGVNLLDFVEENDASDMFTVLIPHGSPEQITSKDSEGKTTTKSGDNITIKGKDASGNYINKEHPGMPYMYNTTIVQKYGWIEKIENWSISKPKDLYDVAKAYFNDYRVDAKTIQAKAFDLKNLLVTETDAEKRDSYLNLESLYLYDVVQVKVEDQGAQYITALSWNNKKFPVQGIRIPLDKFPTDTEYTISNKKARRGILQPGTLSSKNEPKKTGEEEQQKKDEDKKKDEAPKPVIKPIASEYGIDDILAHYPPVYLDHAHNYWRGEMGSCSTINGSNTVTFAETGPSSFYAWNTQSSSYEVRQVVEHQEPVGPVEIINTNRYWEGGASTYTPIFVTDAEGNRTGCLSKITAFSSSGNAVAYETVFGYKEGTFIQGVNATAEYNNFNNVFYTDDLNNRDAYSRQRANDTEESITNWYEKAYYYEEEDENKGVSYLVDATTNQYKVADTNVGGLANITVATGAWFNGIPNAKPDTPSIETYKRSKLTSSTGSSEILGYLRSLPLFGTTLQAIFDDIGIEIKINNNNHLTIDMLYNPNIQAEPSKIRMQSVETKPQTFSDSRDYYYMIGKRMINENTAELFYTYFDIPKTKETSNKDDILRQNELIRFGVLSSDIPTHLSITLGVGVDYPLGLVSCWGYKKVHNNELNIDVFEPVDRGAVLSDTTGEITASVLGAYTLAWQQIVESGNRPSYDDLVGPASFSKYFCSGGHSWTNASGVHSDCPSPLQSAAYLRSETQQKLSPTEAHKANSYEKRLQYAKAYYNATPFMIVTKCVDAVTGNESNHPYGVTYFGLNNDMTITKNVSENVFYLGSSAVPLSINRTGSATPLMICYDTLHTPYYLFHRESPTADVTVANPFPLPYSNNPHSPIMILGRVGGRHTQNIAKGMYMLLSGPTFSSYVTAEEAISPISGEEDYKAPDSSHMTEQYSVKDSNDIWHRWYLSDDMITQEEIEKAGVQTWDIPVALMDAWASTTPEQMKDYYYTSNHCQLVAIGNNIYMKTTNNIYSKIDVAEPEGE